MNIYYHCQYYAPIEDEAQQLDVEHWRQISQADAARRVLLAAALAAKILVRSFEFLLLQEFAEAVRQRHQRFIAQTQVQLVEWRRAGRFVLALAASRKPKKQLAVIRFNWFPRAFFLENKLPRYIFILPSELFVDHIANVGIWLLRKPLLQHTYEQLGKLLSVLLRHRVQSQRTDEGRRIDTAAKDPNENSL